VVPAVIAPTLSSPLHGIARNTRALAPARIDSIFNATLHRPPFLTAMT
jgi:hypothetical protein